MILEHGRAGHLEHLHARRGHVPRQRGVHGYRSLGHGTPAGAGLLDVYVGSVMHPTGGLLNTEYGVESALCDTDVIVTAL